MEKNKYFGIRLAVSIALLAASIIVLIQSTVTFLVSAIDGVIGFSCFGAMVTLGIIGIVKNNSMSFNANRLIAISSGVIGFYLVLLYDGIYGDLSFWGLLLCIYSIVFNLTNKK